MSVRNPNLLLASGLSVSRANSFSRQLKLLAGCMEERFKLRHNIVGTATHTGGCADLPFPETGSFDVQAFDHATLGRLRDRFGFRQVILLGYPDQFPFISDSKPTVESYLWAQFSKPVPHLQCPGITAVPLTDQTKDFLIGADFAGIGPTIPHGIDTEVFRPEPGPCKRSSGPVLCTVGANSFRKRFDLLLEAFGLVTETLPDARLIIKTDAKKKAGGFDLTEMLRKSGHGQQVSITTENLTDSALRGLYVSADYYIHCAEWEGFGIPIIEAMACGLPVITHNSQGPGETVPYLHELAAESSRRMDGETLLCDQKPDSAADSVIQLWNDPALAARLSGSGRKAALTNFDIRIVAAKWLELLGLAADR
ncbi:MAG: glycosyltransferase family 4 protein [Spirochaetales bacterium]|jgi:glycosyltransferase involved in cell wall biosynthesis|nr:glycosyltransferase family 4 protein [Spirochaetales bacterium]